MNRNDSLPNATATILLVDDKPANIRLLFEALKDTGYRTLAAMDGNKALQQVHHAPPDLILLDVMMPGLDGFELCRRLKQDPATRKIPVIFMTALHDPADKVRGFELGAVDYLTKPLAPEEVLARVEAHLTRHRLWGEVELHSDVLLALGEADSLGRIWESLARLHSNLSDLVGLEVWRFHTGAGTRVYSRGACPDGEQVQPDLEDLMRSGQPQSSGPMLQCPVGVHGDHFGAMVLHFTSSAGSAHEDTMRWSRILGHSLGSALRRVGELEALRDRSNRLQVENEGWRQAMHSEHPESDIMGESPALKRVLEQMDLVAGTEATVLLEGESGTGKELFAQRIHERSQRRGQVMIRVNCAAIPGELFESEFFGHVKGAFTGANKDRIGRFELADGGTLFLDEVGEIPLELQGKLLRVLQESSFERVGEAKTRRVNVRIVAATNRNLREAVRDGRFREDLYYRLSVFPIRLPPLRERKGDLEVLVPHLLRKASRKMGITLPPMDTAQIDLLAAYDWPGNIRELQNELERALILSQNGALILRPPTAEGLAKDASLSHGDPEVVSEREWLRLQRENMERALARSDGRVDGPGGAAELLGLRPTTLRSRLKKHGLT